MNRILLFLACSLLVFTGCGQQEGEPGEETYGYPEPVKRAGPYEVLNINSVRAFSDPAVMDTFSLVFYGDSLSASKATFVIISGKGDTIYHESFDAKMLAVQIPPSDSVKASDLIRERARNFFSEDKFVVARPENIPLDTVVVPRAVYEDVMSNPNRVAFMYHLGYEDGRTIAYSDELKKVVLIFNCC